MLQHHSMLNARTNYHAHEITINFTGRACQRIQTNLTPVLSGSQYTVLTHGVLLLLLLLLLLLSVIYKETHLQI